MPCHWQLCTRVQNLNFKILKIFRFTTYNIFIERRNFKIKILFCENKYMKSFYLYDKEDHGYEIKCMKSVYVFARSYKSNIFCLPRRREIWSRRTWIFYVLNSRIWFFYSFFINFVLLEDSRFIRNRLLWNISGKVYFRAWHYRKSRLNGKCDTAIPKKTTF